MPAVLLGFINVLAMHPVWPFNGKLVNHLFVCQNTFPQLIFTIVRINGGKAVGRNTKTPAPCAGVLVDDSSLPVVPIRGQVPSPACLGSSVTCPPKRTTRVGGSETKHFSRG